jgi:hypothetical protein
MIKNYFDWLVFANLEPYPLAAYGCMLMLAYENRKFGQPDLSGPADPAIPTHFTLPVAVGKSSAKVKTEGGWEDREK